MDAFHTLVVNIWTRGPSLADIGTFAVHVFIQLLFKIHINWHHAQAQTKKL